MRTFKCLGALLLASTLSSCMSVDHLPPSYQGPVATIDQSIRIDGEKRNCGFVLQSMIKSMSSQASVISSRSLKWNLGNIGCFSGGMWFI
jgi:hypothetical protein